MSPRQFHIQIQSIAHMRRCKSSSSLLPHYFVNSGTKGTSIGTVAEGGSFEEMALFRSAIGRRSAPPAGVASPCASTSAIAAASLVVHPPGKRMKLYSELLTSHNGVCRPCNFGGKYFLRFMSTMDHPEVSSKQEEISIASPEVQQPQRIKFKRPDKTAKHIMNTRKKWTKCKLRERDP